jgi:DNA-directed RNA polymerase subunit K/omega
LDNHYVNENSDENFNIKTYKMSNNGSDNYTDESSPNTEDIELFDEDGDDEEIPSVANVKRITRDIITKYELCRVIGVVAVMINEGKNFDFDTKGEMEPTRIAFMALKRGLIKLRIRRNFPNRTYEDWKVNELRILGALNYIY